MKKIDKNLLVYLFVLILSWVFIIFYFIKCENEKQNTQKSDFHKLEKNKIK